MDCPSDDERVIIMGGKVNGEYEGSKKVLIYDPKTKTFQASYDMIYPRNFFGCALMRSPMHGNRYVILAVGGDGGFDINGNNTAEIFDYTNPDSNGWEEGKTKYYFLSSQTINYLSNQSIKVNRGHLYIT